MPKDGHGITVGITSEFWVSRDSYLIIKSWTSVAILCVREF
jgi:hypothetical protein